jgi:hypothetical protein
LLPPEEFFQEAYTWLECLASVASRNYAKGETLTVTGGNFRALWVETFHRNQWKLWSGIIKGSHNQLSIDDVTLLRYICRPFIY